MEIIGLGAALLIGISLGLIGGGGSILTVPVLVYLFSVDPISATAYSLFIVGLTSLIGSWPKYKEGAVDIPTALTFGTPSIIAVYLTRRYLMPAIPDTITFHWGLTVPKSTAIMVLFGIMMLLASLSMIIKKPDNYSQKTKERKKSSYILALLEGAFVGVLTGLVGAGGGFLIIPALVLLANLPMKKAVGTSLLIIAAKSLIGFTGDLSNILIDWKLLSIVSLMSIVGIFIGNNLSKSISGTKLQKAFGWLVLVMGTYVLLTETLAL